MSAFRCHDLEAHYAPHCRHAFLLCPGPSLAEMDLSALTRPGVVTMAINRAPFAFRRPTFYTMADSWRTMPSWVWYDPAVTKFVRTRNKALYQSFANTHLVNWSRNAPVEAFFAGDDVPQSFAGDPIRASSMLAAMAVLARLGTRRLYLLGADFHMAPEWPYCAPMQRTASEAAATNRMFGHLAEAFDNLAGVWAEHDFQVANCTPDSRLDRFPRMALADAVDAALDGFPDPDTEWSFPASQVEDRSTP